MKNKHTHIFNVKLLTVAVGVAIGTISLGMSDAEASIAATHIYHNHMPNFWPYYDTSSYATTAVGNPIRYAYDGQAYNIQQNPPAGYSLKLQGGTLMPHDNFTQMYDRDAKRNAYSVWPAQTAHANYNLGFTKSQTQVTMSAAVINDVQSFAELGTFDFFKAGWAKDWQNTVGSLKTDNGFNALEPIHFTGHHSMGPLVGPDYFLKDLIYQNVTLQQDYFLGSKFQSSKGFFPTELGFSERLIPTLKKLGIEWSVVGNNHFARALKDYPYLNKLGVDTLVSPPNRADLQNEDTYDGVWTSVGMAHEQQTIITKPPFSSIPHWVQYIDPVTGSADKIAAIPVDQNGSWLEGWEGQANPTSSYNGTGLFDYVKNAGKRKMYFVIAHDGDNGEGRAGSIETWLNSGRNEYSVDGVEALGVQEYLLANPIPEDDIQHIQDGSWVDTRDSSSDPDWYHWHIPMGVWTKGQLDDFNKVNGTEYTAPTNHDGTPFGHAVSMELGYHYLERNFALLQAALNYAKTAEQIWLDGHPNYWSPSTAAEKQVTYSGNQLNPYMMSYPVKGDEANDYKGGANPAELGWYFLIPAIDSGFGYYDENQDDNIKPTLSFNNSLFFTVPYVTKNIKNDKTGPSMWWVQRYPSNPGSGNASKAEGWVKAYANNVFAIYTYAYDVSGIKDVKVYIREHKNKRMSPTDIAPRVYDPKSVAGADASQVGEWKAYPTQMRDLSKDINGVAWQDNAATYNYTQVPGQKIGNTYYAYIEDLRDTLIDYYMEATDNLGNVTRSEINHTYVGAGRYTKKDGEFVEDVNGEIEGVEMFLSRGNQRFYDTVTIYAENKDSSVTSMYVDSKDSGVESWSSSAMNQAGNSNYFKYSVTYDRESGCADVRIHASGTEKYVPSKDGKCLSKGTYTISADGTISEGAPSIPQHNTMYFKPSTEVSKVCMHYRALPATGSTGWTTAPGEEMTAVKDGWYKLEHEYTSENTGIEFLFNDCGSNWYKKNGSNFVINSIPEEYSVEGSTESDGSPFANKKPTAVIEASKSTIKAGETVTLDASKSTDSDGTIASYKWSTGETTQTIKVSPEKTTSYQVTVTDNEGATSSATQKITVTSDTAPSTTPLVAVLKASSTEINAGETVTLDASNSSGDDITFTWSTGATSSSITVTPKATTSYSVTLKDKNGNTETKSVKITVKTTENQAPTAVISSNFTTKTVKKGTEVVLSAKNSSDPENDQLLYKWSTGDTTETISFIASENTTVTLTVVDIKGNEDTATLNINVIEDEDGTTDIAPTAKFNQPSIIEVNVGSSVTFDASLSTDDNGIEEYIWSVNNNVTQSGKKLTYKHTFNTKGTHSVKLTVKDALGQSDEIISTVVVSEEAPTVVENAFQISGPKIVTVNENVTYQISSNTSDAVITWFIDGAKISNTSSSLDYTFLAVGTHSVSAELQKGNVTEKGQLSVSVIDVVETEELPTIQFGSQNGIGSDKKTPKNFVETLTIGDSSKNEVKLFANGVLTIEKPDFKKARLTITKTKSSTQENCFINNDSIVCGDNASGDEYIDINSTSYVNLKFVDVGEYTMNFNGVTQTNKNYSGDTKVTVENTTNSATDPTTPESNSNGGGSSGGGSTNPLAVILLLLGAMTLRRKQK